MVTKGQGTVLLRRLIGEALRRARVRQGRTLRDVSTAARVSLGYLSEVERGQKEASSELIAAICEALDVRLSDVLREVSEALARREAPVALPQPTPAPRLLVPAGADAPETVAMAMSGRPPLPPLGSARSRPAARPTPVASVANPAPVANPASAWFDLVVRPDAPLLRL
jgi:transcriptional regulator with XRE-family HTH domain